MKILWLVNIVMPELAEHLGRTPSVFGGWLTGALNAVRAASHDLIICTTESRTGILHVTVGGIAYYIVPSGTVDSMEPYFSKILQAEQPDIVHIYGTEFAHSWALAKCADVQRTVVTVQGAMTVLKKHVYAGLPEKQCRDSLLHKLLRKCRKGGQSIDLQRRSFERRAVFEQKLLNHVQYANGGSEWGNTVAHSINPTLQVFDCKLILRDSFYLEDRWSLDQCKKHSIIILFSYPIKGFHMFLDALPQILRVYPDTQVTVIGNQLPWRNFRGFKKWIQDAAPDYNWLIQKKIEALKLKQNLHFVGHLNESQIKEFMLQSNVFISASAMENQSTTLGEAMLLGVPSVASAVGAVPEMIDHGVDGFLYPFDEPALLAEYVCCIFSDSDLAKRFSEKGHNHAAQTYNREINARNLLNMYETIYSHNQC